MKRHIIYNWLKSCATPVWYARNLFWFRPTWHSKVFNVLLQCIEITYSDNVRNIKKLEIYLPFSNNKNVSICLVVPRGIFLIFETLLIMIVRSQEFVPRKTLLKHFFTKLIIFEVYPYFWTNCCQIRMNSTFIPTQAIVHALPLTQSVLREYLTEISLTKISFKSLGSWLNQRYIKG